MKKRVKSTFLTIIRFMFFALLRNIPKQLTKQLETIDFQTHRKGATLFKAAHNVLRKIKK